MKFAKTRQQTPPPSTTHQMWAWSGIALSLALSTSFAWYVFWVVMTAIKLDIKHIVNWYFFARFNLTSVPQTYEQLERVGYWLPLVVFAVFLSSCFLCPHRMYLGKIPQVSWQSHSQTKYWIWE